MKKFRSLSAAVVLLGSWGIFSNCGAPAEPSEPAGVSLESLLKDMTDRARPARLPSAEYTCRQFSSYDRDAVSPDDPATWFANLHRCPLPGGPSRVTDFPRISSDDLARSKAA